MVRVMLVDDHEVVRQGIRWLLEAHGDFEVVAEANSAKAAVELASAQQPDVVVMDVRLGSESGIEATRDILTRHPKTRVVMLTTYDDDEAQFASIMAGASGYVLKQVRGGELVRSIRAVAAGENLLDQQMTNAMLERMRRGKHHTHDQRLGRLSAQEERILTLVAEGRTNAEIGSQLQLAEKTVKNYVSSILSKLEVRRRAEAAAYLVTHTSQ